ncbi:hypothetical protein CBL_02032 [Carabus blaptoides fortunei]
MAASRAMQIRICVFTFRRSGSMEEDFLDLDCMFALLAWFRERRRGRHGTAGIIAKEIIQKPYNVETTISICFYLWYDGGGLRLAKDELRALRYNTLVVVLPFHVRHSSAHVCPW